MLQLLNLALALFLLLMLGAGVWRAHRGPTSADRMLAVQLFGTTLVAVLLLLAQAFGQPVLRDVALVFAGLAVVTAAAYAQGVWPEDKVEHDAD